MDRKANQSAHQYRAIVTGYGAFVPPKKLTNDDLASMVDTSDEWITERTGIKTRYISNDNETTAYLATEASKRALEQAGLDAKQLDLIIVATVTPEVVFPATACFVQKDIGAEKAWVFDLNAACCGFIYSLATAQQFLETGRYKNALVIGAETLTKITNWQDRSSCILFGDGAGAVVLQRSDDAKRRGIIYSTMSSDGTIWETLNCKAYGSRYPASKEPEHPDDIYMHIDGRQVYQLAVRRIVETVNESLEHCGMTIDDVDMLIPHQMNARIIESASKRLNLPEEKIYVNIQDYGNTSAASIPIALDEAIRRGKIKQGDIIVFVSFGAGLTWGANVIEF